MRARTTLIATFFPALILGAAVLMTSMLSGCGPVGQGNTQMARGDYGGAEASFKSVLAANPDNVVARRRLGVLYFQTGRYDQAAAEFSRIVNRDRMNPMTQIYYGVSLVGAGRVDEGYGVLASFSHPNKFRVTQEIRDEASRRWGVTDPKELMYRMERAWEEGERQENIDNRDGNSRFGGGAFGR